MAETPAHLSTLRTDDQSTDVVLKDVIPRSNKSTNAMSKFFKEVCLTYSSRWALLIFVSWIQLMQAEVAECFVVSNFLA